MQLSSEISLNYDFLALGEAVVDIISSDLVSCLSEASQFDRFVGGQVTNLAMNMARLGNRAALGTCVGDDGFGKLIQEQVYEAGVNSTHIQMTTEAPTTLISITQTSSGTPDFIVYRGADDQLMAVQDLLQAAAQSKILHTSAFGLSRDPARTTIIQAMQIARENGNRVSIDPNYHPKIWPDVPRFLDILQEVFQFVNITKPSLDDCARIFGSGLEPIDYAKRFLEWGAELVVITMGDQGVYLAEEDGDHYQVFSNKVSAVDVTGAGDAFWSGLLTALLDGQSALDAVRFGQIIAEIKIGRVGPLSIFPDRQEIYAKAKMVRTKSLHS